MINYLKFRIFHDHLTPIAGNRFFIHDFRTSYERLKLSLGFNDIAYTPKQFFTLIHRDCTNKIGNNASIKHADIFIPLNERNIIYVASGLNYCTENKSCFITKPKVLEILSSISRKRSV